MTAPDQDFTLTVTVRLYGGGNAEEAAGALRDYRSTFDLPGDREAEILEAAPADTADGRPPASVPALSIPVQIQLRSSSRPDWQDDCLIAIEDGRAVPAAQLGKLPPWRAVLIARVAARAGVPLERGTVEQLHAEAVDAGGAGTLGPWWNRPAG